MHLSEIALLVLLTTMIILTPYASAQIIIPIPPIPPNPPNPPPSPQPPPQQLNFIVVDDDGLDCPNANFITRDLSKVIDYAANNATITLCTGTYRGFSNAIVNPWGQIIGYKPLVVKGNGSVEIIYNYEEFLGDIVLQNLKLIVSSRINLRGGQVKLLNTIVTITTDPDYCIQEPSEFWNGLKFKITEELLITNTTITSTNCGVLKGKAEKIRINNSILDVAVRIHDTQLFIMYDSVKTPKGSEDPIVGLTGIGLVVSPSHPSLEIYAFQTVIEKSTIAGTMYINAQTIVFRKNTVNYSTSNASTEMLFNLPVYRSWYGFDGVIFDSSNYTIEYNVFKNYINFDLELYGAVRILNGTGIVRRNLFYGNDVALIVSEYASPIVYDNVFIKNNVHMASIQFTEIASIDPPRPGPNVIGGPLLGGNYWDDYVGPDFDGDGLGDIPYANNYNVVDIHPLTPWGLVKCPPYMGGYKLASNSALPYAWFRSSLIILVALALGITTISNRRRLRGLTGIIGITATLAVAIAVIVLVFQISYVTTTSMLTKPVSPLTPLGSPLIANGRLHLTLYNPSSAPVCVKYAVLNSSKIILYPMQQEYLIDLANTLEKQLVVEGKINYTLILGKLVNALIIEPKDSKEFTAYVGEVEGIADLSIIANNGIWRMYAFGKD